MSITAFTEDEKNEHSREDHPESSCVNCEHRSDCATHNEPAFPAGQCDCKQHRTITIDIETGEWISGGPITGEEGARIAASVLPGMPPEEIDRAYSEWLNDDQVPDIPGFEGTTNTFAGLSIRRDS